MKVEIVTKPTVKMELDADEAQFLVDVMGRIAGSPVESRRKYANLFYEKLTNIGYSNIEATDIDGILTVK